MAIHNRYLPRSMHRGFNAFFTGVLVAALGTAGVTHLSPANILWDISWWLVRLSPIAAIAMLFVDPDRFSVVNGIAGDEGYNELEPRSDSGG